MSGVDFEQVLRDRPERLEREAVLATPAGGSMHNWLPVDLREPLTVVVRGRIPTLIYIRWQDEDGEIAYWREDVWMERFMERFG